MSLELDAIFFILAIFMALVALRVRSLLAAVIVMGIFSYFGALLYTTLGAVDVGFNEAVLGAGITSIFFITALFHLEVRQASPTHRKKNPTPKWVSFSKFMLLCGSGAVLLLGTLALPLRDEHAPAIQHVAKYYLDNAYNDTHTLNVVTSMIADYRAFDTLGETLVVFIAALACLSVLFNAPRLSRFVLPSRSPIVQVAVRLMIPFMQLFGLYVVFHGHYSPGGGFQGGALIGASLILKRLLLKSPPLHHTNPWIIKNAILGLIIFGGLGVWALLHGQAFLDYAALPFNLEASQLRGAGILIAEIGVAFTVAASMLVIFDRLVRQPESEEQAV